MRVGTGEMYRIFWGDTHHNSYTTQQQDPSIAEILSFARTHLDFYSGAYYTPTADDIRLKYTSIETRSVSPVNLGTSGLSHSSSGARTGLSNSIVRLKGLVGTNAPNA